MRRSSLRRFFRRHRHVFKLGRMRGLTSIPVRFRGKRL